MIEISVIVLWAMLSSCFILGVTAIELDLRRNLKKDSSIIPMVFGKDIKLKEIK